MELFAVVEAIPSLNVVALRVLDLLLCQQGFLVHLDRQGIGANSFFIAPVRVLRLHGLDSAKLLLVLVNLQVTRLLVLQFVESLRLHESVSSDHSAHQSLRRVSRPIQ